MGSIIQFTPAMRMAIAALLALCVAGLAWRGYTLYQADQRALKAAAFLAELESGALAAPDGASAPGGAEAPPVGPPARQVVVHVEGGVNAPGVYTLPEGSRVHDAIVAAGGPLPDAVPGVLNLAAPLVDGAKIYVYRQADLEPAAPPPPRAQGATYQPVATTLEGSGAGGQALVNINTASQAELESVPGIGPATARAIIAYRTEHGPFRRVDDLINVSGIGQKTLEKLRPYLTN
ncbi:competence protein ComEA [Symbiobacterium terraclitae]|uniref:Competence protein ComEA n=1 Tax=Symbiobacterium terraclitae TaxID=557451 RepID=A0ABS4JPE7_9FIRM|nr:helix-hairpin-helix domain-containing protein [Symbiobacterium terraclitae]MBP2017408.1 competence protein ComEA [Symbiobacterium terraclitae]